MLAAHVSGSSYINRVRKVWIFFSVLWDLSFPVLAESLPIHVNALIPYGIVYFCKCLFHALRNASALPCCVCSSALPTYLCLKTLLLSHQSSSENIIYVSCGQK